MEADPTGVAPSLRLPSLHDPEVITATDSSSQHPGLDVTHQTQIALHRFEAPLAPVAVGVAALAEAPV